MRFLTLAAALSGAALAAPASTSTETITIEEYTLRKTNGAVQSVSFKLSGADATDVLCSIDKVPKIPSDVVACGNAKYRFGLAVSPVADDKMPGLAIYHELGPAVGRYAIDAAPGTYCHLAGGGPDDYVCSQTSPKTIVIS